MLERCRHPVRTIARKDRLPVWSTQRKVDVANAINEVGRLVFSRDALMWWIVGLVMAAISTAGFVGCGVGVFVTVPWMISSSAVAYRDVFGFDDPNRTNA